VVIIASGGIRKTLSIEIGIIMLGISKIDKNFADLAKFA